MLSQYNLALAFHTAYSCIFHPCNFDRIAFSIPAFSVAPWLCQILKHLHFYHRQESFPCYSVDLPLYVLTFATIVSVSVNSCDEKACWNMSANMTVWNSITLSAQISSGNTPPFLKYARSNCCLFVKVLQIFLKLSGLI